MKKNILFHADSDTALNGAIVLSNLLIERIDIDCYIIYYDDLNFEEIKKKNTSSNHVHFIKFKRYKENRVTGFLYKYNDHLFASILLLFLLIYSYKKRYSYMLSVFDKIRPCCFIPYTDRRGEYEAAGIRISKERKIRVAIPPYSKCFYRQALDNKNQFFRFETDDKIPYVYRIARKINPKWTTNYEGKIVFWDIPSKLVARRMTKMDNPNPWMPGATLPDIIGVYSQVGYDDTIKVLGAKECNNRLYKTMRIEDDAVLRSYILRDELRKKLSQKYVTLRGEIVILSGMAFAEAGRFSIEENHVLHGMIIEALLSKYSSVVLSLHPKMRKENYIYPELSNRIIYIENPLRDIIGTADLLVVAEESSVVDWADMLCIPMIKIPSIFFDNKYTGDVQNYIYNELITVRKEKQEKNMDLAKNYIDLVVDLIK